MRFRVQDDAALVVVRDSDLSAPPRVAGKGDRPLARLKELARAGQLFFVDGEDPIDMELAVFASGPPPADLALDFEPQGGGFLLDVPSGRVVISGYEAWLAGAAELQTTVSVPPGSYLVVAHGRGEIDPKRYAAAVERAVGKKDLAYHTRVAWLGLLGCLPLIVLGFSLLAQRWRMAGYVALAVVISWLPFVVLSRTRRYREIGAKLEAHSRALPVYLLELRPVTRDPSLAGGWIVGDG
jgi:hypothetical protein